MDRIEDMSFITFITHLKNKTKIQLITSIKNYKMITKIFY